MCIPPEFFKDIRDGEKDAEEDGVLSFFESDHFEGSPVEDEEPPTQGTLEDLVETVVNMVIDDLGSGNLEPVADDDEASDDLVREIANMVIAELLAAGVDTVDEVDGRFRVFLK